MQEKRKMLDVQDYVKIANEWASKTITQLAEDVGVSENTIRKAGKTLRDKDSSLCPLGGKRKRGDIADEAIAILSGQVQEGEEETS